MLSLPSGDITHVIQLAVAPVFLLTAVATMINAMNVRLGRIVDRRRVLLDRQAAGTTMPADDIHWELESLARRSRLVYLAIFCAVLSALLVCLVVAGAFIAEMLTVNLAYMVATFFVLAMFAMIASLSLFLREVFLAVSGGTHYRA